MFSFRNQSLRRVREQNTRCKIVSGSLLTGLFLTCLLLAPSGCIEQGFIPGLDALSVPLDDSADLSDGSSDSSSKLVTVSTDTVDTYYKNVMFTYDLVEGEAPLTRS